MPTSEWYSPGSIKYNKAQFCWIVREVCGCNQWPSDGKESGYIGGNGKSASHHASYETVKMITGECEKRLSRCHSDGLMLEFLIRFGDFGDEYCYQKLARYMNLNIEEVRVRVRLAMRYCTGFYRKKVSYRRFVIYNMRRDAERKMV